MLHKYYCFITPHNKTIILFPDKWYAFPVHNTMTAPCSRGPAWRACLSTTHLSPKMDRWGDLPHTWTNGRMLYQQASCFKHLPNFSKSKVQQSHYFLIYPKINRMIKVGYSIDLCIHLICDKTEIMLKHLRNGTCISLSIEYQFSFFKNQLYYIHVYDIIHMSLIFVSLNL